MASAANLKKFSKSKIAMTEMGEKKARWRVLEEQRGENEPPMKSGVKKRIVCGWLAVLMVVFLSLRPLLELGRRSAGFHDRFNQKGLGPAWMYSFNLFAEVRTKRMLRDIDDRHWHWWLEHWRGILFTVLAYSAVSIAADGLISWKRARFTVKSAQRFRAAVDLGLSFLFLWKLYGFFAWVVYAIAVMNYLVVLLARHRFFQERLKLLPLALAWVLNITLVLEGRNLQIYLFTSLKKTEELVNRFLRHNIIPSQLVGGKMMFYSQSKFGLYRGIDFVTTAVLEPQSLPKCKHVPEFISMIRYASYGPLVWQGPFVSFRDFEIEMNTRFKKSSKGIVVRSRPWREILKLTFNIAQNVFLMEVFCHHWFATMFMKRKLEDRFRSSEVVGMMFLYFTGTYLRMLITWRYFRLWAALDGVSTPENFPKCIFKNTSIAEFWRNFNASIHLWVLSNVYKPVVEVLKFHSYMGTCASFVFMALWHGGDTAWILFSALNAVIVIWEQATNNFQTNARPYAPLHILMLGFSWAIKMVLMMFFWFNFRSTKDTQIWFERPRALFGRAFLNETFERELAETLQIDNELLQADRIGSGISYPNQVLAGTLLFFAGMRWIVYAFYDLPALEVKQMERQSNREKKERIPQRSLQQTDVEDHGVLRRDAEKSARRTREQSKTICQVLDLRSTMKGKALIWLNERGKEVRSLSFAGLRNESLSLAEALRGNFDLKKGDRVVLVFTPGLDFVVSLFACMYLGVIAVPVYPPDPEDIDQDRIFRSVLKDCRPKVIVMDTFYARFRSFVKAKRLLHDAVIALLLFAMFGAVPAMTIFLQHVRFRWKWSLGAMMFIPDAEFKDVGEQTTPDNAFEATLLCLTALASLILLKILISNRDKAREQKASSLQEANRIEASWFIFRGGSSRHFEADENPFPEAMAEDIAYLQYTSGSTSDPKGVCITHQNIMHQGFASQISFACRGGFKETAVNWCPQYHDLGLVAAILSSIFAGVRLVSFSPQDFLKNPLLWVKAISRYRASFSAAPNFAYSYTARKARALLARGTDLEKLDLSSWHLAGNGGEPVRIASLQSFNKVFEPHGFRADAHFPCFGLAEHTILASGRKTRRLATVLQVDPSGLERHEIKNGEQTLVGCGEPFPEVDIKIVDPESLHETAEVGEIWISSHSVAKGYWGKSDEVNAETFQAQIQNDMSGKHYLRTGDLGFLEDGELFICGRLKDLIIIDGRNVYPQDLELSAEEFAKDVIRPGSSAAFTNKSDRLTLVVEARRGMEKFETKVFEKAAAVIHQAISVNHRLQVNKIFIVEAQTLPKTSSGKIRRKAIKALLEEKSLHPILLEVDEKRLSELGMDDADDAQFRSDDLLTDPDYRFLIIAILAAARGCTCAEIEFREESSNKYLQEVIMMGSKDDGEDDEEDGASFSSIDAVHFVAALQDILTLEGEAHYSVPPDAAFRFKTIGALAFYLLDS